MRIQTHPGQITSKFHKPALAPAATDPVAVPEPVSAGPDRGDRFAASFIGAAILGGSAAMGAFYPQARGITAAAAAGGLSGLTGAVMGAKSGSLDAFCVGGVVASFVGALSAMAGHAIGPSFAIVAGAVGGGLGYLVSAK